jgi:AcrR family transcriptional regulator
MTQRAKKRLRRPVDESRGAILEAAEQYLIKGGPEEVKVQRIARDLGMTDAAIHYHFGSREGLLESLLRFSGRRFLEKIDQTIGARGANGFDLSQAAAVLCDLYARRGTARLAMWLSLSGWSPEGEGMLCPLVERLHAARVREAAADRPAPDIADSQKLIALLGAVTFAQALAGDAHLRSAGLSNLSNDDFLTWLTQRLGP